ncbi:RsmB/NOP family class I SAM-dependent RNA methyltransferase [Candidatus Pacearchaeota archaeon]|nr:RsmB/NOP family class I SAM-dependent RNA methyltransferase [Candidatus Pacearchaeota archaeon]
MKPLYKYEMKPEFKERMRLLLPNPDDFQRFEDIIHTHPRNFIRCNTLKIAPADLLVRLRKKWTVEQPFPPQPEILLITEELQPGELGNALEHILGFYYVQELSSMLSVLALMPEPGELVLDLCASPGSKSSQIAAHMQNQGSLIANDLKLDRIKILAATLERCGVTNALVTQADAVSLCLKLTGAGFKFDRILLDAPCSGEGTMRSSPKTFIMWNPKMIDKLSRMQRKLIAHALKALKPGGTLVYSTCTHAPEENELVIDFALRNFPVRIESVNLPVRCRPGITSWKSEQFNPEVSKACRIYPQDNDSEGFFLCKMTLLEEVK